MAKKRRGAAGGLRGGLLDTQNKTWALVCGFGIKISHAGPADRIREALFFDQPRWMHPKLGHSRQFGSVPCGGMLVSLTLSD